MEPDDDIEEVEDLESENDDFSTGDVECDQCEKPGVASTPDGDWLCKDCYEEWMISDSDPWWADYDYRDDFDEVDEENM